MNLARLFSKHVFLGRFLVPKWPRSMSIDTKQTSGSDYWRDAAALIVAGRDAKPAYSEDNNNQQQNNNKNSKTFDYRVLLLEEGKKTKKVDKRGYVFPGGMTCEADFSIEWANVFRFCQKRDLGDIIGELKNGRKRPPILSDAKRHSGIPPELGFRLTAIRETFVKTGVLLVKGPRMPQVEDSVFEEFRDTVIKDPRNFSVFCKDLNIVPDVWSLLEWGNWLTPVQPGEEISEPPASPKRYDTISFLCCLDWIPLVQCDGKSIKDALWTTPDHVSDNDKKLGPQQAFELARLYNFGKVSTLHTFASQRSTLGMERYMCVYIKCKDGILCVLPGDDLYPEKPDMEGLKPPKSLPHTIEELRSISQRHHRQELPDGESVPFYSCNVNLKYGQPIPHKQFSQSIGRL